ncbi:MAG TPA: hypothetical protein VHX61_06590 [Rhizomicrobium sp.]|jgi:hypothetical protein|nr:hypothetical protein [Rhizomicrobium sp.]
MNSITKTLLGGTAFCALATAPAMAAGAPSIHVAAAHPGHQTVLKTSMNNGGKIAHITSTIAVSTSDTAGLKKVVKLAATYYTFYDSGSFCNSSEKQKQVLQSKKTKYAKLGTSTETYSGYCSTAPTVFYGDTYKLTSKDGEGKNDAFVSTLTGKKIHYNGGLYDIDVNMDVSVTIGQ